MPLVIRCKRCSKRLLLSEEERKIYWALNDDEKKEIFCTCCKTKGQDCLKIGSNPDRYVTMLNHDLYTKGKEIMLDDKNQGCNHIGFQGLAAFVNWIEKTYSLEKKDGEITN